MEAPVTRPADPYPTSYPKSRFTARAVVLNAAMADLGCSVPALQPTGCYEELIANARAYDLSRADAEWPLARFVVPAALRRDDVNTALELVNAHLLGSHKPSSLCGALVDLIADSPDETLALMQHWPGSFDRYECFRPALVELASTDPELALASASELALDTEEKIAAQISVLSAAINADQCDQSASPRCIEAVEILLGSLDLTTTRADLVLSDALPHVFDDGRVAVGVAFVYGLIGADVKPDRVCGSLAGLPGIDLPAAIALLSRLSETSADPWCLAQLARPIASSDPVAAWDLVAAHETREIASIVARSALLADRLDHDADNDGPSTCPVAGGCLAVLLELIEGKGSHDQGASWAIDRATEHVLATDEDLIFSLIADQAVGVGPPGWMCSSFLRATQANEERTVGLMTTWPGNFSRAQCFGPAARLVANNDPGAAWSLVSRGSHSSDSQWLDGVAGVLGVLLDQGVDCEARAQTVHSCTATMLLSAEEADLGDGELAHILNTVVLPFLVESDRLPLAVQYIGQFRDGGHAPERICEGLKSVARADPTEIMRILRDWPQTAAYWCLEELSEQFADLPTNQILELIPNGDLTGSEADLARALVVVMDSRDDGAAALALLDRVIAGTGGG